MKQIDLADLLAAIQAGGTKVVTLREVPLSLEDAYMAISGIDESADEEEPVPQMERGGA